MITGGTPISGSYHIIAPILTMIPGHSDEVIILFTHIHGQIMRIHLKYAEQNFEITTYHIAIKFHWAPGMFLLYLLEKTGCPSLCPNVSCPTWPNERIAPVELLRAHGEAPAAPGGSSHMG